MDARQEILLRLYEDAMAHVRHLEEDRSGFATLLIAAVGAVLAFGLSGEGFYAELYAGLLLAVIGVFGAVLVWRQNEKINYHRSVAIRHGELISKLPELAADGLEAMRTTECEISAKKFSRISRIPTGLFWFLLYFLIFGCGIFIIANMRNKAPQPPAAVAPAAQK
jgi:hypothetical protein